MSFNTILIIAIVVALVSNLAAIAYGLYLLLTGSYKRYAEQRKKHLEHFNRVQNELNKRGSE